MLGSVREEGSLGTLTPGSGSVYVVTTDPDAVYGRVQAARASITREMRDEDYGSHGFSMRDPEGVHWSFGTYRGEDSANT